MGQIVIVESMANVIHLKYRGGWFRNFLLLLYKMGLWCWPTMEYPNLVAMPIL